MDLQSQEDDHGKKRRQTLSPSHMQAPRIGSPPHMQVPRIGYELRDGRAVPVIQPTGPHLWSSTHTGGVHTVPRSQIQFRGWRTQSAPSHARYSQNRASSTPTGVSHPVSSSQLPVHDSDADSGVVPVSQQQTASGYIRFPPSPGQL